MDLTASTVNGLIVHRIGNKLRDETLKLSKSESPVNEELSALILGGYLKGISAETNQYYFHHETDLALNETRFYASQYFRNEIDFVEVSRRLATHLYENSLHPNIREGDLLVILFDGISYDNRMQRALGIFKSEVMDNYLTITDGGDTLSVTPSVGINPNLIDKGALILEDGDVVFAVDRFGNKTKFWLDDFLKVRKSADPVTCSRMMSFIAGKVAEAIHDPLDRTRYGESIAALCESNENLTAETLAAASQDFVDENAYGAAISKAQRRFGIASLDSVSAPSTKINKNLTKKISKLELRHGISLLIPGNVKLSDVQVTEGANGEMTFTIRVRRQRER
jgi:hypothetical protein